MSSLLHALLDLLFPPKCIYCQTRIKAAGDPSCLNCLTTLPLMGAEEAILTGSRFSHCLSAAWYEGDMRRVFLQYKFHKRRSHAGDFSLLLAQAISLHFHGRYDLITWIPVSRETLRTRGFDQARLLAEGVADILGRKALPVFAAPPEKTPQSSQPSAQARRQNVQGLFSIAQPAQIQGQRILLIDDVITTGATLEEAAAGLVRAGAGEVLCATLCRTRPGGATFDASLLS